MINNSDKKIEAILFENNIQIKRTSIDYQTDHGMWTEIFDASNPNYQFFIINVFLENGNKLFDNTNIQLNYNQIDHKYSTRFFKKGLSLDYIQIPKENSYTSIIKRKYINEPIENRDIVNVLNISNKCFNYHILNIWLETSFRFYTHISSDRWKSSDVYLLYNQKEKEYYVSYANYPNHFSRGIILDYIQIPKKIDLNFEI